MNNLVRLDRFLVPAAARAPLLARIAETHALLRGQPGFVRDAILERPDAEGTEIVTWAEWASEEAIAAARAVVAAWQARIGFDPKSFLTKNGITAALATFHRVDPAAPRAAPTA